ncbi:hypothetical protein [Actinomadura fibrosa]|uniref:Uncharacterized protein n=1 Tax=Actinomadura fibrosa TaxID=111802 RepID=A0ABW2Y0W4_9ACTN|nr:hypothetical protein [Actinomadura fibrosa]
MQDAHEMLMVRADASGREEWACPTCGRRITLRWPPLQEKLVIEPGDEQADHTGSAAVPVPAGSRYTARQRRWLRETAVRPAEMATGA